MTLVTLAQHNGSGLLYQAWLQHSVRSFFEGIAWNGRQQAAPANGATQETLQSPMTQTVHAFFSSIAWEGQPTIAAPTTPLEVQPSEPELSLEDSMTLDAFSDLF